MISQLRAEINQFKLGETKILYDASDKYKDLLRHCPQHDFELWLQTQTFYNELNYATRSTIDVAIGGSKMSKTAEEDYQFFEELVKNNYQAPS